MIVGEAAIRFCLSGTRLASTDRGPRRQGPGTSATVVPEAPTRPDRETSECKLGTSPGTERAIVAVQGRA